MVEIHILKLNFRETELAIIWVDLKKTIKNCEGSKVLLYLQSKKLIYYSFVDPVRR